MGNCVATIMKNETCGNPTPPGYKFCEEHKNRPKAVAEREEKSLSIVVDATEAFTGTIEPVESSKEVQASPQSKNIYEKTSDVLERALGWEQQTWDKVQALNSEDWYHDDKAGVPQPNPLIGMNERAQDRTIRAVTAIAKLNIDAQSVNVNRMVRELIKSVVIKSMERAGFNPDQIHAVRQNIAQEFERIAAESTEKGG